MNTEQQNDDRMPAFDSPELKELRERAMKLSTEDICELLNYTEIRFASNEGGVATYEELKDIPKDMLLNPLDEASSRSKVEHFLKKKGV